MASVKISELQSLTTITDNDVLLVTDIETSTSRKASFDDIKNSITLNALGDYESNQELALQEGLATGYLYVQNLNIGG